MKPVVLILIVMLALMVAFLDRNLVLADMDDSISLFGYELRLQLKAEIAWDTPEDRTIQVDQRCAIVPDTLEAQ